MAGHGVYGRVQGMTGYGRVEQCVWQGVWQGTTGCGYGRV